MARFLDAVQAWCGGMLFWAAVMGDWPIFQNMLGVVVWAVLSSMLIRDCGLEEQL